MSDQTPTDPLMDAAEADKDAEGYYAHCDQVEREEARTLPPIPDVLTAIEEGTLTPEMALAWMSHPMVSVGKLERECINCVDRARAAEREQHQREIAALTGCPHNGNCACAVVSRHEAFDALCREREKVAQQAETIRQLQAQIAEIDNLLLPTAAPGMDEDGAWKPTLAIEWLIQRLEAAEASCATLTQALEQMRAIANDESLPIHDRLWKLRGRETTDPQRGAPR